MSKINVLLLFGGISEEYEVSCVSASYVLENMDINKYKIIKAGITKDGNWYVYSGPDEKIRNCSWTSNENELLPCAIGAGNLYIFKDAALYERIHIDIAFPMIHGGCGEDGAVQGVMKLAGIPCCGADITGSVCAYDKSVTNALCEREGILQAEYITVNEYDYSRHENGIISQIEEKIGYPVFIKPAAAGSSIGISKAIDSVQLKSAVKDAFKYDNKIIAEEYINGREIEVAVLGNKELIISECGEINSGSEFYDYDAKYVNEGAEYYIPARLDDKVRMEIKDIAAQIYRLTNCSGYARIDFFVTDENKVYFNEINTIPGFTNISMYAKLMSYSGVPYNILIDKIIELAGE